MAGLGHFRARRASRTDGPANAAANFGTPPVRQRGRFEPRERFERQVDAERFSNDPHSPMNLMAAVTGGRYLHDTNDLATGLEQAVADLRGSYTLGLKDQLIFPEIDYSKVEKLRGMNITFVTTARSDEESRLLLQYLGMPFRNQ